MHYEPWIKVQHTKCGPGGPRDFWFNVNSRCKYKSSGHNFKFYGCKFTVLELSDKSIKDDSKKMMKAAAKKEAKKGSLFY